MLVMSNGDEVVSTVEPRVGNNDGSRVGHNDGSMVGQNDGFRVRRNDGYMDGLELGL